MNAPLIVDENGKRVRRKVVWFAGPREVDAIVLTGLAPEHGDFFAYQEHVGLWNIVESKTGYGVGRGCDLDSAIRNLKMRLMSVTTDKFKKLVEVHPILNQPDSKGTP